MDGNVKSNSLVRALIMLVAMVAVYGLYKISVIINLLVIGATSEVALSGNIAVPGILNDSINTTVTDVAAGFALFTVGDTIILGLIGLVVILVVFAPWLKGKFGGKSVKSPGFN